MRADAPWRDLVVSLSLVNLWFLKLWLKILPYRDAGNFFLACSPRDSYLAAVLNVLAGGLILFLLVRLARRSEKFFPWLVLVILSFTVIVAAYGAGASYISLARFTFLFGPHSTTVLSIAISTIAALSIALLVRYRRVVALLFTVVPMLFAPYLLVTFGESAVAIAKVEPSALFHPHAVTARSLRANPLRSRVVWVIFDETDYRLGFQKRPLFLSLPAFDSLCSTSLSATAAYSPNDNTQTSLPSLITGLSLTRTIPSGARRLQLEHRGTLAHSDFTAADTIFKQIKKRGGTTGLCGWYLPYSRVMKDVDVCRDYSRYNFYTSDNLPWLLLHQWREIIDLRFLPFRNTVLAGNQIGMVQSMRSDVAAVIANEEPSLLFLHYSVPHSPNVYDRRTGTLAFNRDKRTAYFDNLALADRCLADLRREMEAKGIWDSSLVIVSSDHHWRTNTYDRQLDKQHVPFIVKFPRQRRALSYSGRFSTLLTKELILDFVDGKINNPEDACRWLDQAMRQGKASIVLSEEQPDAD